MTLFSVDSGACLRDGICVAACPSFLLEMPKDGGCPTPVNEAERYCNRCGHCATVCPTGALSLSFMPVEECALVRPDLLPSEGQYAQLVRTRRSIRNFTDQPLSREAILGLLDLARYAPTGSNRQQVEWLVVHDRATVRAFASVALDWLRTSGMAVDYSRSIAVATENGFDLICRGAPHLVIAHTPKGRETDGVIAATHLELAAYAGGFGACWGGFANAAINNSAKVRQVIDFPDDRSSCGVMLLGYPQFSHERVPQRNPLRVQWR